MNIEKYHNFEKNDVYFMETLGDKIVVNSNYKGLMFLNSSLTLCETIAFFEDEDVMIDLAAKKNHELILLCSENDRVIYVNYEKRIINPFCVDGKIFDRLMPFYHWKGNMAFFYSRINGIVSVDSNTGCVMVNSQTTPFNFEIETYTRISLKYYILKYFQKEKKCLVRKKDHEYVLLDMVLMEEYALSTDVSNGYHDFALSGFLLVSIGENEICVENLLNHKIHSIMARKRQMFLCANFVKKNELFVIGSNKSDACDSFIIKLTDFVNREED